MTWCSRFYNGNTEFADFVDKQGKQLIPQEYNEEKWAKAAAACRDLIDYADETGVYRLYTVPKKTQGGECGSRPKCAEGRAGNRRDARRKIGISRGGSSRLEYGRPLHQSGQEGCAG